MDRPSGGAPLGGVVPGDGVPGDGVPGDRVAEILRRLSVIRARIASAGGDLARVRIVAVTKGFGPDTVVAALGAGLTDFGENYANELIGKAEALRGDLSGLISDRPDQGPAWHFLGQIQRNKVPRLAPIVSCWQSVDRIEEGRAIARSSPGAEVLVEVGEAHRDGRDGGLPSDGVGDGSGRGGVPPEEVAALVDALRALGLQVRGCMTVAPREPARAAESFSAVGRLVAGLGLEEASMGMSDDLEDAVRCGSTMVRVGRALFGERPAPRPAPAGPGG